MLGCIQPISSPMMKRMFGFCAGAWAYASVDQSPAHSEQAKSKVAQTNWPSLPLMMRFMMYLRRDSDRYCDAFSSGSFILLVCAADLILRAMTAAHTGPWSNTRGGT